jgi:hypothetical protein
VSKSYDLTDWDREEYVQDAHLEAGVALEAVVQARRQKGDWLAALEDAERQLESLRQRLALRLSDVMEGGDETCPEQESASSGTPTSPAPS